MTVHSSTLRSTKDATVEPLYDHSWPFELEQLVADEWHREDHPDLVRAIERHPQLLRHRSLLLNLAIHEYRAHRKNANSIDLVQHCYRFHRFGSSFERSIFRQLEAQRYIDDHPELLGLLEQPKWPEAGEEFGGFQVLEELGRGAAARVYLCSQEDVGGRRVVVKAAPFSGYEASILGRLSHANIVPIHSMGVVEDRDLQYLCMPFCGRSNLADLLDVAFEDGVPRENIVVHIAASRWAPNGEIPAPSKQRHFLQGFTDQTYVGAVLKLAIQLADALDHAHSQNILHGDLKPSNVLLTPNGQALLLDFNLSQDDDGATGLRGGTLPYMPPEHLRYLASPHSARSKNCTFDVRSDIYSFGALIYELLTGLPPTSAPQKRGDAATAADILLQQLQRGVAPIRQFNRLVSRRLDATIMHCLAFDPSDRPGSVREVKQSLERDTTAIATIIRIARLRPLMFSCIVVGLLALVIRTSVFFASLPPLYESRFAEGMRRFHAGELTVATEYFTSALDANPDFGPARFQRALARLASGKPELALSDFEHLAMSDQENVSNMVYIGYCFNAKGTPVAAIPWYERAISTGARSAAVYNNLGASLLVARGRLSPKRQLEVSRDYLNKALAEDPDSRVVKLNIVRLETALAKRNGSYNPAGAWRNAIDVLNSAADDLFVRAELADWYAMVLQREQTASPVGADGARVMSDDERQTRSIFAKLLDKFPRVDGHPDVLSLPGNRDLPNGLRDTALRWHYVEPIVTATSSRN